MTPLDRVLDAARSKGLKIKKRGGGFAVQCPAHEDRDPSLSISEGNDGRVLLICRTGCSAESVVTALGLEWTDLFEPDDDYRPATPPKPKPEPLPVAPEPEQKKPMPNDREANVAAAHEKLLANEGALERLHELRGWSREAIRALGLGVDPRGVLIPIRDGRGKLVGVQFYKPDPEQRGDAPKMQALSGSARELFPAVESVPDDGGWLFLCEGEPDAITLWSHGLFAVSCPGVNGWQDSWAERFKDRRVCIVFDCDAVGRKAARGLARKVASCATETRLLDLDPRRGDGFDVSDWLRANDPEKLVELADAAELIEPDGAILVSFSKIKRDRVEWLIPARVPLGALSLLVGDPGEGKSLLTCLWAADLSTGVLYDDEPHAAILVNAEDSVRATIEPRLEAAGAFRDNVYAFGIREEGMEQPMKLPDDLDALEKAIVQTEAKLVVIDPLSAHLPERVNSWSDQSIRTALAPLYKLAERHGCAVVVVAHLNKATSQTPLNRIGASVGIPAAARSVLAFGRHPDNDDMRVLAHAKCNVGPRAPSIAYAVEPILLEGDGKRTETAVLVERGTCGITVEELLGPRDAKKEKGDA